MLQELLFWSENKNSCTENKDPNFCAKVLNLIDLHFMITSEGAKPHPKSSSHADPLHIELLHKSFDPNFENFCTKVLTGVSQKV